MPYKDPQKNKECIKKYHQEHREELNKWSKEWRENNPERANAICKKYRDTHKQERYVVCTAWRKNNLEKARAIQRKSNKKVRATIQGNLNHRMEVMIWQSLKKNKAGHKWEKLVGYTIDDLKQHLEKLFTSDMNWEKLLNGEIQIDHIKPRSLFQYETAEDADFKKCWALENLQPLEKIANIKKGNKYIIN